VITSAGSGRYSRLFKSADSSAEACAQLGKPLRPKHQQRNEQDDDQMQGRNRPSTRVSSSVRFNTHPARKSRDKLPTSPDGQGA